MGFVHKAKGGVWWFLLLAAVLLAAVGADQDDGAVATAVPKVVEEEEVGRRANDQGNDMCDIKCQHHQVPARKKQCVDECHSREHHHPSRAACESKCSHWVDPTRKEQCVQQCMRRGLSLHVGGSDGVGEHPHAREVEVGQRPDDQGNDMCDIKCQHHQVPARKKQCVDECHSREHHHPSRAACESKCSHWVDPTRKEQCVQQCMRRGLSLHVGGSDGVGEHPHAEEAEVGRRPDDQGNDMCDIKCQHHQVPARKKQCVDECHSREHHHPSRASCETKCSHWVDPTRKEQCVQQCMRRGLSLHVGGSDGVDEHPHAQEEEIARLADDQGNDSCDIKCQHHQVPARKKQCVDECHSREHHHPSRASCETKCSHWVDPTRKEQCVQQCMRRGLSLDVGGSNDVDEDLRGWEAVAGAIIEVV